MNFNKELSPSKPLLYSTQLLILRANSKLMNFITGGNGISRFCTSTSSLGQIRVDVTFFWWFIGTCLHQVGCNPDFWCLV